MKHIDSHLHVRGESQYVDDVPPPAEMLHAAVAGSPKAHGIITRLDTGAARAAPGVVAVLTAADIPGVNRFGPIFEDEELAGRARGVLHRPSRSPWWWPAPRVRRGRRAT